MVCQAVWREDFVCKLGQTCTPALFQPDSIVVIYIQGRERKREEREREREKERERPYEKQSLHHAMLLLYMKIEKNADNLQGLQNHCSVGRSC